MKRIRILATSDVHGNILPLNYADNKYRSRGFAKIKTAIDCLKDDNTIVLDNGDVLEGTALAFYHYDRHPDELSPFTKAMNAIEYDYVNVGNHDFDHGEEALMMHLQNLKAPCITSNWIYHGKPFGPTYVIREIAGKKIALFALTTAFTNDSQKKSNVRHSKFQDAVETAKRTVNTIRRLERPDYVVCLYHGGFERDVNTGIAENKITNENQAYRLCREISGIDVLIAGHTHHSMSGRLFNTTYIETGSHGTEIACIDILPDTGRIETHILKCDMDADTGIIQSIANEEEECQAWLDKPLGTAKIDLSISDDIKDRVHKPQLITFMNKAAMDYTRADLSASSFYLHTKGLPHEITMRDLVSSYVYPNTLVVKQISGKTLREYLEKCASYFALQIDGTIDIDATYVVPSPIYYNYDMIDGVDYTINVSNPVGSRITELKRNGEDVTDDMMFTIAVNNYRAIGGGDYMMLKDLPTVREYTMSIVDMLANYIRDTQVIDFEPVNNITVTK